MSNPETIERILNEIVNAGYQEVDSARALDWGAQSFAGKWWVPREHCDSIAACMDECEAVLCQTMKGATMYQSQIDARAAELEAADKRMDTRGQIIDSGELRAYERHFGPWCYQGKRYCKPDQKNNCIWMLSRFLEMAGVEDVKKSKGETKHEV